MHEKFATIVVRLIEHINLQLLLHLLNLVGLDSSQLDVDVGGGKITKDKGAIPNVQDGLLT